MHTIYFLIVFAAVCLPALVFADKNSVDLENESVTLSVPVTPKPLCEERRCPRLYWPVCSQVDGEQVTAPSRCVLNNKIRCSKMLRQLLGKKVPVIRFLHAGACSPESDRSNVVRMRDASDGASRRNGTYSKQIGEKDANFEQIIDEMIDDILYGDSGENLKNDEDIRDVENIDSDEDSDAIIDRILDRGSIEGDQDRDAIIDGIPESVENGDDGIDDLEEEEYYNEPELYDDKEGEGVVHRRREANIDKSWLSV